MKFKNYIFDLDGTLVNSSEEVLKCFEKAFEKANYEIDKSRLSSDVIGPPLLEIIKSIAPNLQDENKVSEIIANFRQIYDYDENDISVMYDGILDVLKQLKLSGKKMFIATFKPQIPTIRVVEMFGIKDLFDDIYTIDKFGKHITKDEMISNIVETHGLNKTDTVMVGDAASDVLAAKTAGVTGVGVLWGYGSDKTKLIENSDFVIEEINKWNALVEIK